MNQDMNQDIKQLLELAALACGYTLIDDGDERGPWCSETGSRWRPDLDDGDGARMEAGLRIEVGWNDVCAIALGYTGERKLFRWAVPSETHNGNRQAARRMASLRVAAEVGRGMKG